MAHEIRERRGTVEATVEPVLIEGPIIGWLNAASDSVSEANAPLEAAGMLTAMGV